MKSDFVIGVLGGMGTYATIHLFRQYAEIFPAEKEWERPRLVIDNRCTMPSRVRAALYGENESRLVAEMSESLENLLRIGCTRIILGCNTSHLFLPRIAEKLPGLREKVVSLIDACANAIAEDAVPGVFLLGTEGTLESRVYQNALARQGVDCAAPAPGDYAKVRRCIEAVKQNRFPDGVLSDFLSLVRDKSHCVLGCTELPAFRERFGREIGAETKTKFYDPVELALRRIRGEFLENTHG